MPIYETQNVKTKKVSSDFYTSYDSFKEYLKEHPELEQIITKLNIVTGKNVSSIKTDDGFKDLLKTIKKSNKGSNMDV